jgi:hypothetical protein
MNYDPLRFCTTCQLMRPRSGFRSVPGTKVKRECCEFCFAKIAARREQMKAAV